MPVEAEEGAPAAALDELKAYLRMEGGAEDALLAGLLRGAAGLCEQFIGQWLIAREARQTVIADGTWRKLAAGPVMAILEVTEAGGGTLPVERYAIDIDARGDGWVKAAPGAPVTVRYRAGMAADLNGVPEAIRQGIVRLAAEHHAARMGEAAVPPAAVSALWRPWRRMRLS